MKLKIWNIFKHSYKSTSGFTLIELLASMTILLMVIFPIISIIYSSTKNNTDSQIMLQATSENSRTMENLKSKPAEFFKTTSSAVAYEDSKIKVSYTIEPVTNYDTPSDQLGAVPSPSLEFSMGDTDVHVKDESETLNTFPLSMPYSLEISGTSDPFRYDLYSLNDTKTLLKSGNIESINGIMSIHVKSSTSRTISSPVFLLHTLLGDKIPTEDNLNFYIFEGSTGFNVLNDGSRAFSQYKDISEQSAQSKASMYKITVTAQMKDAKQQELGTLISYVNR